MNTYTPQHYSTATLFHLGCFLHDAARALRRLAERLDVQIATRQRAADDRRLLNQMSERELRDIGVSRTELQGDVGSVYRYEIAHPVHRMAAELRGC
jgi:uncharacterized protein YjiS (DUF1127 family)